MPTLKWSSETRVQAGFALALACIAVIAAASYLSLRRLTEDTARVARTDQVLAGLELLLSTATDGETAERGYVITGDESYLGPYQHATQTIGGVYRQLRELTADGASEQRPLDEIGPLIENRMADLSAIIDLRRTRGFEPAQREIITGRGKAFHDAIRRLIDELKATARERLAERERRTERATEITQAAIIAGGGLALAFVGLSLIALRRDFAGRRRAEQALRAANDQLETRVEERTAELVRASDSLQKSEQRFRAFVNATSDAIYRMSPDWTEMHHLQGRDFLPDTEDPSHTWLDKYIPTEEQPRVMATIREAIRTKGTFELEHRVWRVDGTVGWTFSRAIPLLDENGAILDWFGAASDVSEQKTAEEKLQAQLSRLNLLGEITRAISERQDVPSIFQVVVRSLTEQFPASFCCVCLYDQTGNYLTVTSVSPAPLAAQLAIPVNARIDIDENGLSRCVRGQLVYEPDVREVPCPFPQRLARGGLCSIVAAPLLAESRVFGVLVAARRESRAFSSGECEFLRQLSEHVALAAQQAQLYQSLQRAYDDLKQTQQAVMQQERLLALGKMASGIAHDINNAISPIALYADSMLERETTLSPAARGNLEIIRRAIDDVADTVARMREFYRTREPQQALLPVDLNRLVPQVVDLTRARWSDMAQQRGVAIQVRTELAPNLPAIAGIEGELPDALTNLIFNAVDAMPTGGELKLRTCVAGRPAGAANGAGTEELVQLEVSDAGVGMDEETRRRCLEPFFTTKGERGTGLGLAMVYGTVQRHGADLDVQSAVGKGTTVRLSFAVPAAPPGAAPPSAAPRAVAPLRILIVDDDPLVLKALRLALEADGHVVTATDGGRAGIDAFLAREAAGEGYQVVITDLGMPYVDGRQVATAVKSTRPDTPVLMLTGWGRQLAMEGELPPHVDRVLSKPVRLRELRETFAEVTRRGAAAAVTEPR